MIYDKNQTNLMFDNEILESIFRLGGLLYENYYDYYFGQSSQYKAMCFFFQFCNVATMAIIHNDIKFATFG
jgi:hypothetical protein